MVQEVDICAVNMQLIEGLYIFSFSRPDVRLTIKGEWVKSLDKRHRCFKVPVVVCMKKLVS